MLNDAIIANGLILWYNASQRSVTHDSLRYINILTYLLTYLQWKETRFRLQVPIQTFNNNIRLLKTDKPQLNTEMLKVKVIHT